MRPENAAGTCCPLAGVVIAWNVEVPDMIREAIPTTLGIAPSRVPIESGTNTSIAGDWGPMRVNFDLSGPPQMSPDRVLQLAAMHVRGLTYLPF